MVPSQGARLVLTTTHPVRYRAPKLYIGKGNAKLGKDVHTLALNAGSTCPGADICHAYVKVARNGKRVLLESTGPGSIRCYAASSEIRYPSIYDSRKRNTELIKECKTPLEIATLLDRSIPDNDRGILRLHTSGDIFSERYFQGILLFANARPKWKLYGYTKSIHFWYKYLSFIPRNLVLTASMGGKYDYIARDYNLKRCDIVTDPDNYFHPIDHDDSLARNPRVKRFGLILHGVQPKGSWASERLITLRKQGYKGYSR